MDNSDEQKQKCYVVESMVEKDINRMIILIPNRLCDQCCEEEECIVLNEKILLGVLVWSRKGGRFSSGSDS